MSGHRAGRIVHRPAPDPHRHGPMAWIVVVLLFGLIGVLLAGCGGGGDEPAQDGPQAHNIVIPPVDCGGGITCSH